MDNTPSKDYFLIKSPFISICKGVNGWFPESKLQIKFWIKACPRLVVRMIFFVGHGIAVSFPAVDFTIPQVTLGP